MNLSGAGNKQFYDPAFERRKSETDLLAGIAGRLTTIIVKVRAPERLDRNLADPEHEPPSKWLETRGQNPGC